METSVWSQPGCQCRSEAAVLTFRGSCSTFNALLESRIAHQSPPWEYIAYIIENY
jgi:hypothetical protein